MRIDEVRELLTLISAYDRIPFPQGAEAAWREILAGLPFADAHEAVLAHYRMPDPQRITPGDIRRRCAVMAARRRPRELPAAPQVGARGAAARAQIRAITAAAERTFQEQHPEHRPYRHRRPTPIRVA